MNMGKMMQHSRKTTVVTAFHCPFTSDVDPSQLAQQYKDMTRSDADTTAAIAGKAICLPVVDGRIKIADDLEVFTVAFKNERKTADIYVTVQGEAQR